jgi:hypothetical protein
MPIDQECVDYARECVRLAKLTKDIELRDHFLDLADKWMATGMHESGMLNPKSPDGVVVTFERAILYSL